MDYKLRLSDYFSDIFEQGEYPRFKVLINGKWERTDEAVDLISPINSQKVAEIGSVSKEQVERAINIARESQHKIRDMSGIDRVELINKIRTEIDHRKEELIRTLMLEAGKPYKSAFGEINAMIERMRLSMEDFRKIMGEYLPGDWASDTTQKFALVIKEPIGVVLGISPFNYPVFTSIAKVIPALLAGNSVILKPPSADPIALMMTAEIFRKSGLPDGVFQVLTGSGGEIGDMLVSSDKINMISFTGSTAVGKHISSLAGLKKTHLELGGKAPALVLEDADIDLAAKECVKGSLELAGQRCDAVSRILVVEKIKDQFIEAVKKHLNDYKFGNPMESDDITMGPVISESAAKRIDDMVQDAVKRGAKVLAGGKYNKAYYEPTILVDVPRDAVIAREETFGPIITIITVKDKDDAISVANDSQYGLDSAIFTNNFYTAWSVMKKLQAGNVTLNAAPSHGTAFFPFGGIKMSGEGKEGIAYSIEEMTVVKTMVFNLAPGNEGKIYSGRFKD